MGGGWDWTVSRPGDAPEEARHGEAPSAADAMQILRHVSGTIARRPARLPDLNPPPATIRRCLGLQFDGHQNWGQ